MNGAPQTFDSRSSSPSILSKTSNFKSHYPNTSSSQSGSNYSPQGVLQDQRLYDLTSSSSINQGDFTVNTIEDQDLPRTPSAMFTADYDPFGAYQPSYPNSSGYNMQRGDLALKNSPNSCSPSQRSSFSSAAASTAYSHSDLGPIKNENHLEWPSESHVSAVNHAGDFQSPHTLNLPLGFPDGRNPQTCPQSTGFTSPYYGSPSPLSWGRVGSSAGHSVDLEPVDATGSSQKAGLDPGRIRQPRKPTTKEEANFQCKVKGCGKLFGRSYNYKAHMETHDAGRVYPYPCPVDGCTRRFVRKTDLQRHNQSVHMKQRDFKCDYCSRYFARKDTLRRHMEDGCSKRFDIGTLDISQEHYRPSEMGQEVEWHEDIASRPPIPFTPSTMMPEQHVHAPTAFNSHNHHTNMPTTSNGQTSVWSR